MALSEERPKRKRKHPAKQGDLSFNVNGSGTGQLHALIPYLTTEEFAAVPK